MIFSDADTVRLVRLPCRYLQKTWLLQYPNVKVGKVFWILYKFALCSDIKWGGEAKWKGKPGA